MSLLLNPFVFAAAGDFESIATVTVGSGGAASIDFTNIPGTYQHLQIRGIAKSNSTNVGNQWWYMQLNGDTASNYNAHYLRGDGASASGSSFTGNGARMGAVVRSSTTSVYSGFVIDILDYANTSKNTTMRGIVGDDRNGSGDIWLTSGLWRSTSAVTSVKFQIITENFVQHSTAALYGIKA